MEEIKRVIEANDQKLKLREQRLIQEMNTAYERAIEEATREFRKLEKLSPGANLSDETVKRILAKVLGAFQAEFEVLVEPLQEAMKESYGEGLSETGKILEASKE